MTVEDIGEKIVLKSVTWMSLAEQPIGRGKDRAESWQHTGVRF